MKAARQIPELIGRVMVYGQVVKDLFFNREVYDCLQKAAVSDKERESAFFPSRKTFCVYPPKQ